MPKPYYDKGRYLVRLAKHDVVEKPAGPQLVLRFVVLGRMLNGECQETEQYERSFYRTINEKTAEFAIQDLRALGYDRPSFSDLDPDSGFSFEGTEVEMFCNHEEYNGEPRERWGVVRQIGGGEIEGKRVEKKALRALDNLFGKALKETAKPAPRAQQPAVALGITDEDVPF